MCTQEGSTCNMFVVSGLQLASLPGAEFCLSCAGQAMFPLSAPCWSCQGNYCDLYGTTARLGDFGTTSNATTRLSVPGIGQYRLKYRLQPTVGVPNSWRAIISSTDGSFTPIVLESLVNLYPYYVEASWVPERDLTFSIPSRTRTIDLTFEGRHVCSPLFLHAMAMHACLLHEVRSTLPHFRLKNLPSWKSPVCCLFFCHYFLDNGALHISV
jgi:hypothetical protein